MVRVSVSANFPYLPGPESLEPQWSTTMEVSGRIA